MDQKKLHILFLTSWFPSKVSLNVGDFILRHAEAISSIHKVSVIYIITDFSLKGKVEYERYQQNNLNVYIAYLPKYQFNIHKLWVYLKTFFYLLKKIGSFDIIHLNKLYPSGIFAVILKILKSKKYIISEHWSGYQKINVHKIGFFEHFLSKIITKHASFVCPVTEQLGNEMKKFGLKGNYYSVPNVVNTSLFKPEKEFHSSIVFTHISSLIDEIKNISGIIEALYIYKNINPNFTFYFIGGDGNLFKNKVNNLGFTNEQIIFVPQILHDKIPEYLNKSNALVMFSFYENLPCVILESFACGTPVISTDVGGIKEYFPKEFGVLIPINDTNALVNALQNISIKSASEQQLMYQYCQNNFSIEKIAEKFNTLYYRTL